MILPNLHYDICALLVLIMITFSIFFRKMTKGPVNVAFLCCVLITLITTIVDMVSVFFYTPDQPASSMWKFYLIHSSYYLLRNANLPVYLAFIITHLGAWPVLKKQKSLFKVLILLPYLTVVVMMVINLWKPIMFYFDPEVGFRRGSCIFIMYIASGLYMILGVCFLVAFRKIFPPVQMYSLISIYPLTIIALAIQAMDAYLLVEMFATTLVILLASITVHRPEMLVHHELGTMTKHAYLDELRRIEYIHKPVTIVFVAISNYRDIQSYVPYNSLVTLLKRLYVQCMQIRKEVRYKGDTYYLDNGLFAIVSDRTDRQKVSLFTQTIYRLFDTTTLIDKLEVHIVPQVCYFNCPEDLNGYSELMSFMQTYQSLIPTMKGPVDVASFVNTSDFRLRNELDAIVVNAITHNQFQMYYQPIWSVKEQRFISAEALIRLNDAKYGNVSPELFIAAAERNGSINQIGDFILEDVCRFIASDSFKQTGLKYIEVNLAIAQCLQTDLVDKIKLFTARHGIDISQLNLEITERENIVDQNTFDANIHALCSLGATISLDDYGTGYSNILRISQMPLKIVKIDKSFTNRMHHDDISSILTDTVKMLKDINKEIVIEGVETQAALDRFTAMGCDFIQGYYFSKPLPEKDFVAFCKQHNF